MKMDINDPIYFTNNKVYTAAGTFDIVKDAWLLLGNRVEGKIVVQAPWGETTYLIPQDNEKLKDDARKAHAKNEALSSDGCQEAMVADRQISGK